MPLLCQVFDRGSALRSCEECGLDYKRACPYWELEHPASEDDVVCPACDISNHSVNLISRKYSINKLTRRASEVCNGCPIQAKCITVETIEPHPGLRFLRGS
jgi:hypothetical protein